MRKMATILGASLLVALVIGIALTGGANAHEQREVGEDEQFHFVVGFLNEPAVQGELNGVSVRISSNENQNDDGDPAPIEGLEDGLTFEISYEDQTSEVPVRTVFRDPGHYVADVIPTEPGVYSFHITGEIDGVEIDETFTGGPDTFSEVGPRADLEFPGGGDE